MVCWLGLAAHPGLFAVDPLPPFIQSITSSNTQKQLLWTPYPAADQYQLLSTRDLSQPWSYDLSGTILGQTWTGTNAEPSRFYKVQVTPMSRDAVLTATVLNRLAYGPTPDELERVLTGPNPIGPERYIEEQLRPEKLTHSCHFVSR